MTAQGRPPSADFEPLDLLAKLGDQVQLKTRLFLRLMGDRRVKLRYKVFIPSALYAYLKLGKDVIPDNIPFLGQLDDAAAVALALTAFFRKVPPEILREHLKELTKESKKPVT